ncbi:MAG: hypothetical protein ABW133_07125 [Polyangiaceae bacterium]
MNTKITLDSVAKLSRHALAASLALATLLLPGIAAAEQDGPSSIQNITPGEDKSHGSSNLTPGEDHSRWSMNFTPVLLLADGDYRFGGGIDPELKYTLDRGGVRLSAGARVGAYYAKNLLGITAMPTLRLMVPVGPVEPYVSFGMGYGWLTEIQHSDIATMSRIGVVFRFSESFALGVEGTVQKIERSDFRFPSFGSAVAINF